MLSGNSVTISTKDGKISVNGSSIITPNILASNGVMHTVDSLLLPHGSLALTPEKYLIALNATRFVMLFREAGLSHLLSSSPHNSSNNASYTILATKDGVLERLSQLPWSTLPPAGTSELKETLQYHVIEGKWTKEQLLDGQLLPTMLRTRDLGRQQQRLSVSVSDNISERRAGTIKQDSDIGFGSANVIDEPIEVDNCIIYLISRILEPPSTFVSTALDRGLSTFVASVYASTLDKQLLHHSPATTFLAPTNSAFDYLGLAMNYFLLTSARDELIDLLRYHSIRGIVYSNTIPPESQNFPTLEGSDIYLGRPNASVHVHVHGPKIGGFPANGDNRAAKVIDGDLLTSNGVLHVIDQVELPPTINITSEKLMRGAKASTFPDLLRMVNMTWLAAGDPAPDDSSDRDSSMHLNKEIKKRLFQCQSYTILCPTDKAFTRINLTHYLNDMPSLLALVRLHIIPSPPPYKSSLADPMRFPSDGRPLKLEDEDSFSTLLSKSEGGTSKYGDVAFRKAGESDWLVGIKGARGTSGKHDAARIVGFGRNTPRFSRTADGFNQMAAEDANVEVINSKMVFGGGLLLIDGVLEPFEATWFQKWGYIVIVR